MSTSFLLYGAYGFVGEPTARMAVAQGLRPVLAGRNAAKVERLATELGLPYHVFDLDDARALDRALNEVPAVLHCAGPYMHTADAMVEGCLRTGTHYMDITGEIPVFQAIAARDAAAKACGVMLLPGVGFDVVPTDCLALYLKQRLPSATQLQLAFQIRGPAGLPPGTQRTAIELLPYGDKVRRHGQLVAPESPGQRREVDFGTGPVTVTQLTWGDVFTAYFSTGIPNIEVYTVLPRAMRRGMALMRRMRPLFKLPFMRALAQRAVGEGSTAEERGRSTAHVWGQVRDELGATATARLHGPEATVVWTAGAALTAMRHVLNDDVHPGYQTPARAYGADFVLEVEGVVREDVEG
ncbi:MAG: saccharopine dehydrogenase NADP-binding domain-containing protein [Ardenticatenales bacterium]|nr:saccharopine dehydrogenase NADP-binding domain-containing protein [Ardenticatenales bacterium]